jgi:hypothetical protein
MRLPRWTLVPALLLLVVLLTVRPEPALKGGFGLTSSPPPGAQTAFASFKVQFRSWLRFLVVIENVIFVDNSDIYALEDAWVIEGGSGCVVFADTIEEVGTFPLVPINGYRVAGRDLNIMLRLGTTGTPNESGEEMAGPISVAFRLRFAGLPYDRHVGWDPNNRRR